MAQTYAASGQSNARLVGRAVRLSGRNEKMDGEALLSADTDNAVIDGGPRYACVDPCTDTGGV